MAVSFVWAGKPVTIQVLFTNDLHGELFPTPDWTTPGEPKPMMGGMGELGAYVRQQKSQGPCLLLDAGDFSRGSPEANVSQGRAMIDLMNRIGYDAVCVGDRDIACIRGLPDTIARRARFRLLGDAALNTGSQVELPVVRPSLVREVEGVKVGLIGVLDDRLIWKDTVDSTLLSSGITVENLIGREVRNLHSQNVDVIIVLAHMSCRRALELAPRFPGVAAFICGHDGEVLNERPLIDSGPFVLEAGGRGQRVGALFISCDTGRHAISNVTVRMTNLLPGTAGVDREIDSVAEALRAPGMDDSVGSISSELDPVHGDSLEHTGQRFSLEQSVADNLRDELKCETVILPGSVLDWALPAGRLTRRDIARVLPFDDHLVRIKLPDADVVSALDEALEKDDGRRPLVSGIRFDVIPESGMRAVNVRFDRAASSHDAVLTRSLAIAAGIPSRLYQSVENRSANVRTSDFALRTSLSAAEILTRRLSSGRWRPTTDGQRTTDDGRRPMDAGRVNINEATLQELQTLPGIGPKTAEKIIEYRQTHGRFKQIEDIMKVKGIGKGKFGKIKGRIAV